MAPVSIPPKSRDKSRGGGSASGLTRADDDGGGGGRGRELTSEQGIKHLASRRDADQLGPSLMKLGRGREAHRDQLVG